MDISLIRDLLYTLTPLNLDELDTVRLMDRMDTKYVFSAVKLPDLLKRLKEEYRILEINGERIFNYKSTYFDTTEHQFYFEHVKGKMERNKIRFRQYEISGVTFLEIKRKTRKNRTVKWRIKHVPDNNICDTRARKFINEHFGYDPGELTPVLENSFKRITLAGKRFHERVTIDVDLSFNTPEGAKTEIPSVVIGELKSSGQSTKSPFYKIMKQLSLRPTGFSKYCIGNAILLDLPNKNVLKSKLLLLNKIENEYKQFGAA
jgi:hypothetical protein